MEMLIEGAILAIIVVWLFLRDWRATVVSAIALPLSIIPTFWAIWTLGFTLNILTLLALTLVVGILVDDAIVEVENIVRHLRTGKPPREAAMEAAIEIGLAVVATTLTICAVFIPVAFMSGIAGEFFRPFGFTVTVAVLFSLLVARTLTPMMAAYFLKPHDRPAQQPRILTWYLEKRALVPRASVEDARRRDRRDRRHARAVPDCCRRRSRRPATTASRRAQRRARARCSSLEDTVAVVEQRAPAARGVARGRERLHFIGSQGGGNGFGGGGGAGSVRRGSLTIQIENTDGTRGAQQAFERKATELLRDIPGARLQFNGSGGDRLQVTLAGDESQRLEQAAADLERELRAMPGLGTITSSAALLQPEIVIRPMPDRAAELGVTTETLSLVTRIATSGDVETRLAKFNLDNRQIPIRVRLNDKLARRISSGSSCCRFRAGADPFRSMNVADVSLGSGPAQIIRRVDRSRNVTINANLRACRSATRSSTIEATAVDAELARGRAAVCRPATRAGSARSSASSRSRWRSACCRSTPCS